MVSVDVTCGMVMGNMDVSYGTWYVVWWFVICVDVMCLYDGM